MFELLTEVKPCWPGFLIGATLFARTKSIDEICSRFCLACLPRRQ